MRTNLFSFLPPHTVLLLSIFVKLRVLYVEETNCICLFVLCTCCYFLAASKLLLSCKVCSPFIFHIGCYYISLAFHLLSHHLLRTEFSSQSKWMNKNHFCRSGCSKAQLHTSRETFQKNPWAKDKQRKLTFQRAKNAIKYDFHKMILMEEESRLGSVEANWKVLHED